MTSLQSAQLIGKVIFPNDTQISQKSQKSLQLFINFVQAGMSVEQFRSHLKQWTIFGRKFNTNDKLSSLRDDNYKKLLLPFIKQDAMTIFKPSYFNRAKIDDEYINWLQKLGPYFFIEVVKITSKLKRIHKHFYDKMRKGVLENHIQIKILKILQLCNQKKRSVNSNISKFLCIVQEESDRKQLTIELGKMLRSSWKLDKQKTVSPQDSQINQVTQNISQQPYFDRVDEVLERAISMNQQDQQSDSMGLDFIREI